MVIPNLSREVRSVTLSVRAKSRLLRFKHLLSLSVTPGRQNQVKAREMVGMLATFRPEGGVISSPGELSSKLSRLSGFLPLSWKERRTRCREVSRLVWAWSTVLVSRPLKGVCSTKVDYLDLLLLGLRWVTLDSADLISQFKSVTTKLVQLGVADLSPAAVAVREVRADVDALTSPKQGRGRRVLCRLVARAQAEPGFAVGLYQAKRAAAELRPEFRKAKLAENLSLLSTYQKGDRFLLPRMVEQVRRTVQELRALNPAWKLQTTRCAKLPSPNATWESTRKEGGALGLWARRFLESYPGDQIEATQIACRRVGIPEPFKLRVISAGQADAYSRLLRYQPSLWGLLKDHPCFQLIGRPLERGDISKFWKQATRRFGSKAVALSGDYSAATDNLHPLLAEATMMELLRGSNLGDVEEALLIAGLTRHRIDPERVGEQPLLETGVAQRWGQLMGSPISFPILCLINAAACRYALENEAGLQGCLSLEDAGILVNGDDCLVPLPSPKGMEEWTRVVKACGLNPSPGKCFVSLHSAQLNSTLFIKRQRAQFAPFLRVNLLWGLCTKGADAGKSVIGATTSLPSLASRSDGLFLGFSKGQKSWVRMTLRAILQNDLQRSRPIPIHLHQSWGGLGIPFLRKRGPLWRVGPDQLRVVKRFLEDPGFWLEAKRTLTLSAEDPSTLGHLVMQSQTAWERSADHREDILVVKGTEETPSAPVPWILARIHSAKSTPAPRGRPLWRVRRAWSRLLEDCRSVPLDTSEVPELTKKARHGVGVEPIRRLHFPLPEVEPERLRLWLQQPMLRRLILRQMVTETGLPGSECLGYLRSSGLITQKPTGRETVSGR
nr:RNA-dependent RNA polymerase [Kummerowia striata ourmiavirus]